MNEYIEEALRRISQFEADHRDGDVYTITPPALTIATVHAQLASADALDRIAVLLERLTGTIDANLAEKIAAAQVIEQRFGNILDLLVMGANDGSHHKNWALDQIAREILGPAYDNWAAAEEHGWSNVTENAIAP